MIPQSAVLCLSLSRRIAISLLLCCYCVFRQTIPQSMFRIFFIFTEYSTICHYVCFSRGHIPQSAALCVLDGIFYNLPLCILQTEYSTVIRCVFQMVCFTICRCVCVSDAGVFQGGCVPRHESGGRGPVVRHHFHLCLRLRRCPRCKSRLPAHLAYL